MLRSNVSEPAGSSDRPAAGGARCSGPRTPALFLSLLLLLLLLLAAPAVAEEGVITYEKMIIPTIVYEKRVTSDKDESGHVTFRWATLPEIEYIEVLVPSVKLTPLDQYGAAHLAPDLPPELGPGTTVIRKR